MEKFSDAQQAAFNVDARLPGVNGINNCTYNVSGYLISQQICLILLAKIRL